MKTPKNKIKFNRPRLIRTIIYFVISLMFMQGSIWLPPVYKYLKQVLGFIGILFLILSLVAFGKLFTKEIRKELFRRISSAIFNVTKPFRYVINKIRDKLGLNRQMMNADGDEKTIIVTRNRRKKKKDSIKPRKYNDMETNRERIRFLWTKYILDIKTKKQKLVISQTPAEIGESLDADESSAKLFALYYTARYAGDDAVITDKDVNKQAEFVGTRGKI